MYFTWLTIGLIGDVLEDMVVLAVELVSLQRLRLEIDWRPVTNGVLRPEKWRGRGRGYSPSTDST